MTNDRLLVAESDTQGLRAALLVDGRLEALEIDRNDRPTRVGAVETARVVRIAHGLGPVLALTDGVELLLDRAGSAPVPVAGDRLPVQITREGRGGKLGTASRSPALTGRALIHLPLESGIKASRRIAADEGERGALEAPLAGLPGGWILRRTAPRIDRADYAREAAALGAEGAAIRDKGAGLTAPDAVRRLCADYALPPLRRILVSGKAAEAAVGDWCGRFAPSLVGCVERHRDRESLFALHDLDREIEVLSGPVAPLPGGGSLIIERTEAMTVIDVNAGAETNLLAANLAAAAEIGRQLRLRHVGGIVVIDFVSLRRPADRARTEAALKAALASDPAQTHVLPMSALGLIEMSRERRGPGVEFGP